ncbi:hypothetical protein LOK49_LG09G02721 [Camellia lanceoleosa]|uniref:Uncharacterized protein n=1 Tax=Camellia lanceoleosa TaxID=1840588 RepID=A0ACC0GKH0_9ERIC|nr:hypothetical protein LOK49_LG09G02721 [Camellia lanceoleosa]
MPRKAIQTKRQSNDKFWDFARQFFFGLWGFWQRPYPPRRPIDVAQAIGYKKLENRYYDYPWEHVVGVGLGVVFVTQLVKWDAQLQQHLDKMLHKAKAANERRYFGWFV